VPGPGASFFKQCRQSWATYGSLRKIWVDYGRRAGIARPIPNAGTAFCNSPSTAIQTTVFPHNFVSNTVVYTGTHDNATTRQWYEELPDYQRQNLWSYSSVRRPECEAAPALMRLAWSSPAALAIAPLQDLAQLGHEARMNVPGRAMGTGVARREDMLSSQAFQWLRI